MTQQGPVQDGAGEPLWGSALAPQRDDAGLHWRDVCITALFCGLACWLGIELTRGEGRIASLWLANGLLLGMLLTVRPERWTAYLAASFLANLAVSLALGDPVMLAASLAGCNSLEVGVSAWILSRALPTSGDQQLRPGRLLLSFALVSVAVVGLSSLLAAGFVTLLAGAPFLHVAGIWYGADLLGLALVTPVVMVVRRTSVEEAILAMRTQSGQLLLGTTLLVTVSLGVFTQDKLPLLFLISPALLLLVHWFGFVGAAFGLAIVAAAAIPGTAMGNGPLELVPDLSMRERIALLQVYLLLNSVMMLSVAAIHQQRQRLMAQLREKEAHFRMLTEHVGDMVLGLRADWVVEYASPSVRRLTGRHENEVVGRAWGKNLVEADRPLLAAAKARLSAGETELSIEFSALRADAALIHMETTVRRYHIGPGQDGVRYIAVQRDVSQRWRDQRDREERLAEIEAANLRLDSLARHLEKQKRRATDANEAKSRFLATITHELRTPLHGILGHANLMRGRGDLPPEQDRSLAAMLDAGEHLLEMINRVLELSMIEAGRADITLARLEPRRIAQGCVDLMLPAAEAKGLALTLDCRPYMPETIDSDAGHLRQILMNLISNAVKFTGAGSVTVRMSGGAEGRLRIEVEDTGPGIAPDKAAKLFCDFERLGESEQQGAGLGLAISSRLVSLLGGELRHQPRASGESGSIFWVELPCQPSGVRPEAAIGLPMAAEVEPMRLLVVDDIVMNLDVAAGFLRRDGHTVTCAISGAEALALLDTQTFDAVLMDVRMPGMDGLEATRRIRALPAPNGHLPVLALTANSMPEKTARFRAAGMNGVLTKPFTEASLRRELAQLVRPPAEAPPPREVVLPLLDAEVLDGVASIIGSGLQTQITAIQARIEALIAAMPLPGEVPTEAFLAQLHTLAGTAGIFGLRRLSALGIAFEAACLSGAANDAATRPLLLETARATHTCLREWPALKAVA